MNLPEFLIIVNPAVSFQMCVEVERKFLCSDDILKTIKEVGGMCTVYLPHCHTWIHLDFS